MKKLLTFLCLSFFAISSANSEISVGISGTLGMLDADGKETISGSTNAGTTWGATAAADRAATATAATSQNDSEDLIIGYGSLWAEGHLGSNVRAGLSYVPYALESETTENTRVDNCAQAHPAAGVTPFACSSATNKVQVDLVNLMSLYLSYHADSFFLKAGVMSGDLETDESLSTGAKYGDASLEGTFVGGGIERDLGTDMFVRTEVLFTQFDDIKLTASGTDNTNTIDVTNLGGINASVSVGKTF
tara:strand:+ start:1845 stop:2585 length:741 start_codon:yes stop_codon:yes gene_type:complete